MVSCSDGRVQEAAAAAVRLAQLAASHLPGSHLERRQARVVWLRAQAGPAARHMNEPRERLR